jgi:glycine oxidase
VSSRSSIVVVGAGIIGLTSAFRLARAGHGVTVVDPAPASGATYAAAGMVAPSAEVVPGERDNYDLQCRALPAWRHLARELEEFAGAPLEVHESGTLLVGWDASDRRLARQFVTVAQEFGVAHRAVGRAESPADFAGLSDRIGDGVIFPEDGWLDPDQAVAALRAGLDALSVEVRAEVVGEVGVEGGTVVARTPTGEVRAQLGLVTTGAAGLPPGLGPALHQVRPVRGITTRVEGLERGDRPTVRALVRGRAFYLVRRPGGYCVLGASSEERHEPAVEVGELARLLRDALDVVPALEGTRVLETRVGLRPASVDGRPFLESLGDGRWAWLSGHYRHGMTLAPLAAQEALEWVERAP